MNDKMAHRGPDDQGIYFSPEQKIGLTHRRLAIIDLSPDGHQPMWDCSQSVVISYNGEIFNYRTLRKQLETQGWAFQSQSDTEVLLNLYMQQGVDMLAHLNGMFAFALWDTRTRTLFLARDGVGVKPLYYTNTPQGFLFASELKAFLQAPGVDKTLNVDAIHQYLTYLWCAAPQTMLQTVHKLAPGHALMVQEGKIQRHWQFYDLPYHQEITPLSENEAIEALRFHVQQAVARQMVADVPVGAFLSGGLDSSAVAVFAQQALQKGLTGGSLSSSKGSLTKEKLQCFTIGFKDASFQQEGMADDLPYAQQVAAHLGVDLHTVYVGSEMADQLETMLYHLDEPQADPAPLNALFISRLAREQGITVLLSGAGGDDIFSGYRRHYALMQEKYWQWLPLRLRQGMGKAAAWLPAVNVWGRRFSKALRYAGVEGDRRIVGYFQWLDSQKLKGLYGPLLEAHSADLAGTLPPSANFSEPLLKTLAQLPADIPPLNRMLYLEGKHFLADHNLNYTDKMGMETGIEVRVPLLDPDLVNLAARLPLTFKQRGPVGKWVFKKAMEAYLPPEVIYRPKTGFGVPLRHWLRHEWHPLVEEVLSESSLQKRGLFSPTGVQNLIFMDQRGKLDGTYTIFSLMCIELWCRLFLD